MKEQTNEKVILCALALTFLAGPATAAEATVITGLLLFFRYGSPRRQPSEFGEVDMDPKRKAALITGGARIGRDVAHALALRGCSVALTYRHSRDIAEATVLAARNAGVQAIAIHADAAEEAQVNAAIKDAAHSFGKLDILINMASTYLNTPSPSEADWTDLLDSNAKSAFLFSIYAAPIMKCGSGGRIINFADWLPASGRPRYRSYVPYYASKSAVIGLTEALALESHPTSL